MNHLIEESSKKYNIIYLIDGLGWGGAERLMIPILSNIDRQFFSVRVCTFKDKSGIPTADEIRELGIPVDRIPVSQVRDITAPVRIANYLKEMKADLLHAQLEFSTIFGGIAARSLRMPSIATLHTIPATRKKKISRLRQLLEHFCLRHFFDMVISVSEETHQFYQQTAKIPDENSRTIYNGIDLKNYAIQSPHPNRISALQEFGIPADATVLMTVAVLREPKGVQYAIRAMPSLLKLHPQLYYLVIGGGAYYENLQMEAKQAGIENRVIFTGARTDIPALMPLGDLFVLPTLTEALPTVLAEAMAAGLPILASHVGGIPEMVQEGINGRLIPPANPELLATVCHEMLQDPQKLRAMGIAGRRIVEEKFNVQMQVKQLQELYIHFISKYPNHKTL